MKLYLKWESCIVSAENESWSFENCQISISPYNDSSVSIYISEEGLGQESYRSLFIGKGRVTYLSPSVLKGEGATNIGGLLAPVKFTANLNNDNK